MRDAWGEVGQAWHVAFEAAWESYRAGSPPVGAVVVDPDGKVVAIGRSRRGETDAPANQLSGSRLAHAEINALAQLGIDQHHGYELYVTLEPCLLCWAAIRIARIPVVRFAGVDPMWNFLESLGDSHQVLADRPLQRHGPLAGPLGAWATLLPLIDRLQRDPVGLRLDQFREVVPSIVALAERLVAGGADEILATAGLEEALASLWDDLETAWVADSAMKNGPGDHYRLERPAPAARS